jgi:hypothetical protein
MRLLVVLALTSCAQLQQLAETPSVPAPRPPRIAVSGVTLEAHPAPELVARALCPRVAPEPVCLILGGAPGLDQLRITFALGLDVTNDNAFPLPLVEALVAFTAYPQQAAQNLGAVCLSFCEQGAQCPVAADACRSGQGIRTMSDFTMAAVGFLAAVAVGKESVGNLKVRTIAPGQTTHVSVALQLDPVQTLGLLQQFAGTSLEAVKRGSVPVVEIPYAVEGTAWVHVEHFGKIGAGFGAVQGAWRL